MIPSDHFVRFYNEVFKYIIAKGPIEIRRYYDRVSKNQEYHCLNWFREKGLRGMYEYWEHIRIEENCDMANHLEDDCYWFEFFSCPSLSKAVDNDAGPCREYCNHCPGWILPIMTKVGYYAVYNLISRTEPRCMMFVYRDKAKAEAKKAELIAQYGTDVILDNLSEHPRFADKITSEWYDVAPVNYILEMPSLKVAPTRTPLADRRAVKDVFQSFGLVENATDGRKVSFPAKSAGKMLGQRGIELPLYAYAFAALFKASRRAWSEKEAIIESHKEHRNITAYHQYIAKASLNGEECYVRFTVREDAGGKNTRNEVHSSTVSRITVYKAKGVELSDLGHAQVEDSTPFVDNKISYFMALCQGGIGK